MKYGKISILLACMLFAGGCATKHIKPEDPLKEAAGLDLQIQQALGMTQSCEEYNLVVAQINMQLLNIATQVCQARQEGAENEDPYFRPRKFVKCVKNALVHHAVEPLNCNSDEEVK